MPLHCFKRLRRSGSRAMFTGVDWYGNQGQVNESEWFPLGGPLTVNYYKNVENSFDTAAGLKAAVAGLPGESKYIAAHSLGNMLVSSAIVDKEMSVSRYFMIDAAVAMEAYNGNAAGESGMLHPAWNGYDARLRANEWCNLFPGDERNKLTWKNRFGNIPNAINYFISGSDPDI